MGWSFNRKGDSWGVQAYAGTHDGIELIEFQSQGRFLGGSGVVVACDGTGRSVFQSQGRFLGGSGASVCGMRSCQNLFQSQGRFLGGSGGEDDRHYRQVWRFNRKGDSWGVQARHSRRRKIKGVMFQSQGRFLGGSGPVVGRCSPGGIRVSIARAILGGFRQGDK